MLKIAARQGRHTRRDEAYSVPYVESLSEVRTKLADFFSILLPAGKTGLHMLVENMGQSLPILRAD